MYEFVLKNLARPENPVVNLIQQVFGQTQERASLFRGPVRSREGLFECP
jgi:hypothetical protein